MQLSLRITILLCLLGNFVPAQHSIDDLDKKAKSTWVFGSKNPNFIANRLCKHLHTDKDKALVLAFWIAHKISYDLDSYMSRSVPNETRQLLKTRKALCHEYARLYKELCAEVGIDVVEISGYTKHFDFLDHDTIHRTTHAWHAVNYDKQWHLMDLTYASGYEVWRKQYFRKFLFYTFQLPFTPKTKIKKALDRNYILPDPVDFVFDHIPNFPDQQLLNTPVPLEIFRAGWHKTDSFITLLNIDEKNIDLTHYLNKDDLNTWEKKGKTSISFNPGNNLYYGANKQKVADSLASIYYNPRSKIIYAATHILDQIENEHLQSDSLLQRALTDNLKEYEYYKKRNYNWKKDKNEQKKEIKKQTSGISTQLTRQIAQINKIEIKAKRAKTLRLSPTWGVVKIARVKRPEEKKENLTAARNLRFDLEKMHQELNLRISENDSLLTCHLHLQQTIVQHNEKEKLTLLKEAKNTIKLLNRSKVIFLSLIHVNRDDIEKQWLTGAITNYKQSKQVSDSMLNLLSTDLNLAYANLKFIRNLQKKCYTNLCKEKSCSHSDQDEISIYRELRKLESDYLEKFQAQCSDFFIEVNEWKRLQKQGRRCLKRINHHLVKDYSIECLRHRCYNNILMGRRNFYSGCIRSKIRAGKEIDKQLNKSKDFFALED